MSATSDDHEHQNDTVTREAIALPENALLVTLNAGYSAFVHDEKLDQLGHGGQSQVFRAEVRDPNGDLIGECALKRIYRDTHGPLARGPQEAETMRITEHRFARRNEEPGTPRLIDYFEDDKYQYVLMELLPGSQLDKYQSLSWQTAADITSQILHTLAVMHGEYSDEVAIVHGDVTLHNVVFDGQQAKLCDFGIARFVGEVDPQPNEPLGKFNLLAPEQANGVKNDPRSDIFGAGGVMLDIITNGAHGEARKRDEPIAMIYMTGSGDYLEIIENQLAQHDEVPEAIKHVIRTAMALDPADRYQTAGEMQEALQRAVLLSAQAPKYAGRSILRRLLRL